MLSRKALVLCAAAALLLSACGSGTPAAEPTTPTPTPAIATAQPEAGDTVRLTLPAEMVGEVTEEQVKQNAEAMGYASARLNSDGSVTYTMTPEQRETFLETVRAQMEAGLEDLVSSGDYGGVLGIAHNPDFTEFTVTVEGDSVTLAQTMLLTGLYYYGGMYGAMQQALPENIHVAFADTEGKVLREMDSRDLTG